MIISRTPVRISFFGGGTDYREYYLRHSGAVLGTTINKYVYVSLNRVSAFFDYKTRVSYSKTELVNAVGDIVHPSVRECLKYMNVDGGLDIHIFADLPARTGLGSSSTFTVGFLHALYALEGKMVSKEKLFKDALYVEQELLKENVGSQDQCHAAYGGLNLIRFRANGIDVHPVIVTSEKKKVFEDSLLVFYTGQTRFASQVVKEQVDSTRIGLNDSYLKRMHEMVEEAEKVISDSSPSDLLKGLGSLMKENWELKKSLSNQITNSAINQAYEAAINAGAYGGKLCGAGSGGFLFFLVEPEKKPSVRQALRGLLEVEFKFEDQGSSIIYMRN